MDITENRISEATRNSLRVKIFLVEHPLTPKVNVVCLYFHKWPLCIYTMQPVTDHLESGCFGGCTGSQVTCMHLLISAMYVINYC